MSTAEAATPGLEEFADIPSIPQNDGDFPVVRISYSPEFDQVMAKFRGLLIKDERSERALRLTQMAIELNPANYSAWVYRRKCLDALSVKTLWEYDLEWCAEVVDANPKNYQVWFHRRRCVEVVRPDGRAELDFVADGLRDEPKNYHAWGYRQWVVRTYGLWDEELAFTEELIEHDPFNNSAWNQRFFVLKATGRLDAPDAVAAQVLYTLGQIRRDPSNASPWNFLDGLLASCSGEMLASLLEEVRKMDAVSTPCAAAMAMLVTLLEGKGDDDSLTEAASLCSKLGREHDPIRAKYWAMRQVTIERLVKASE